MNDRVVYSEIKTMLLVCYWRGCRDYGLSGWSHEQVCAWAYGEFEGAYDLTVEILMLEVASSVLSGGWSSNLALHHATEISRILYETNIEILLQGVPCEEAEELINDLTVITRFSSGPEVHGSHHDESVK